MSGLYTPILALHVVVAVMGLGSIASVAIVTATARTTGADALPWLSPLLRYSAISLAAMLVTGILLDLTAKGAFRQAWWFRGSALLLLATGALHGQARRAFRAGVLRRVEGMAYGMCALILTITILMEVKPF